MGLFAVNDTGTTTASAATYGSPTTAYSGVFDFDGFGTLDVPAATWNTTGATLADDGKFAVVISSATDGDQVSPPFRILSVASSTRLRCEPLIGSGWGGPIIKNTATRTRWRFDIVALSRFRIASIALYSRGSTL